MDISIIPDFTVMSAVRHKAASFGSADDSRKAFEYATEISIRCSSQLILAEQIIQKLKFNDQQKIALAPFSEFDKTTIGVEGQEPKNCIVETANSWVIKSKVIVIYHDSIKLKFKKHPNLCIASPQKFIKTYEEAKKIKERVKDIPLTKIIIFLFFVRPNLIRK